MRYAWPWAHDDDKPKPLQNKLTFAICTDTLHQPVDCRSRITRRNLINKTGRARTVNGRFTYASVVIYVAIVNWRENIATADGPRWHNVKVASQFIADKMFNIFLWSIRLELLTAVWAGLAEDGIRSSRSVTRGEYSVKVNQNIPPNFFSLKRCELWTVIQYCYWRRHGWVVMLSTNKTSGKLILQEGNLWPRGNNPW